MAKPDPRKTKGNAIIILHIKHSHKHKHFQDHHKIFKVRVSFVQIPNEYKDLSPKSDTTAMHVLDREKKKSIMHQIIRKQTLNSFDLIVIRILQSFDSFRANPC